MEEDFNDDVDQIFVEWCLARGFTLETPDNVVLQAMADEAQQRIEEAEARGVQRMKRIDIDGSIVFDTIEQAK